MPILIEDSQKKIKLDLRRIRRTVNIILQCLDCGDKEISLMFVDNDEIQSLNKKYLDRDYPTNVISFPLAAGEFGDINPNVIGDIVISVEMAGQEADFAGIELNDALDFLIIHGTLHLLNYDHENTTGDEAKIMQDKEHELFFKLKGFQIE